jgi:hypothetical protein
MSLNARRLQWHASVGSTYQYNLVRMVVQAAGISVAHSYLDPEFSDMPGDGWPAQVFQECIFTTHTTS